MTTDKHNQEEIGTKHVLFGPARRYLNESWVLLHSTPWRNSATVLWFMIGNDTKSVLLLVT